MENIFITGTGLFHPEQKITNSELVDSYNKHVDIFNDKFKEEIASGVIIAKEKSSAEFITKASGIESRYVFDKKNILNPNIMKPLMAKRSDEENSYQAEMSIKAAKMALEEVNLKGSDIDLVILACSNFERPYPAISIEVQKALGAEGFAYDLNVACSSATFGICAAIDHLKLKRATKALVINPEICSGHLDFTDRECHFIFGDAATAAVLELEPNLGSNNYKIIHSALTTSFSNNIRNNGGFLNRFNPEISHDRDMLFKQKGRKVFKEVIPLVSNFVKEELEKVNESADSIKKLWLHQANLSMNDFIFEKVKGRRPGPHEAPCFLNEFGNTSSAGTLISFHRTKEELNKSDKGIICSFGAGLSAGLLLVEKV